MRLPDLMTRCLRFPLRETLLGLRPEVKYAGVGVLGVVVLLLVGRGIYHRGFRAGVDSGLVSERVNADAVRHVEYVLQLTAQPDAALLEAVRNRGSALSWIRDAAVRREVQGRLLDELARRGLLEQVADELPVLLPPVAPESPAWAQRMQEAARCLAMRSGGWEKACAYLRAVEEALRARRQPVEDLRHLRVELALAAPIPREQALHELEGVLAAAGHSLSPALAAEIHLCLGGMLREQGAAEKAHAHFEAARSSLAAASPAGEGAALCAALALYESGAHAEAAPALQQAVDAPPAGTCGELRLMALRCLADYYLAEGQESAALRCLYRAEGEAAGCVGASSAFWPAWASQFGWVLYTQKNYDEAMEAFTRALAHPALVGTLRAQPLEGMVHSALAMGKADAACRAAQECVTLWQQSQPAEAAQLGRAYMLVAQASDQAGRAAQAAEAYAQAAANLPEGSAERESAMVGRAYALMQDHQWAAAAAAWQELKTLPGQSKQAQSQLLICNRRLSSAPASAASPTKASGSTSSTPRNTRRVSKSARRRTR
ncbi:MAG: hypothetical protein J1E42_02980 [Akkermansiaceae bacterium]|nr:hypothetical protein [Akkermansiaceae bacterium]